jgi:type VI secretion system secreted protein VgrG
MAYREGDRYLYLETPLGEDKLLLQSFEAREGLNQLFDITLELLAENATTVDFDKLIGQKVSFGVLGDGRAAPRDLHGIVVEFSQGTRDAEFTAYRMRVAPEIWKLTRKFESRIFQHINVPDILKKVLAGYDVTYEIQGTFEQREYCTQYRETDFDFASRLMEEEGIYYFFKFTHGSHKLVLANTPPSHPEIPGDSKLIFEAAGGGTRDEERISRWQKEQFWGSGKYTVWDHHHQLPHKKLDAQETVISTVQVGKVSHKLKLAGNEDLEVYDNPGRYAQRFDGIDKSGGEKPADLQKISQDNKRTVGIRMQQTEVPMLRIDSGSNCRQITPGHKFTLQRHFNADGQYVITEVSHSAKEADFRTSQAGDQHYENFFSCIPYELPFRPLQITRRPTIAGPQTAVVVGPAGEEIFTDKYGRVKVQFHWDREGKNDVDSSCWLRVSTLWAGKHWGMIHLPRIGQEVMVAFIEGDPDRPIIVGSVYNSDMMPPYDLPANKTQSGVKSRSSKNGGSDNYNEIMFEDLSGSEMLRIHAEKDQSIEVEHDEAHWVGHDRKKTVDNDEIVTIKHDRKESVIHDHMLEVGNDRHETVGQNQNESVGMTYSRSVGMNINDKAGMNYAMDAGTMIHLKAGMAMVIEAGMGLTIKSAGGSIDINPAGVFIQGNLVLINTGMANIPGCGSSPTSPTAPGQISGLVAGAAAAGGAAAAMAASIAQQAQQQAAAAAATASSMVSSVANQAFGAVSQVAGQAMAAAESAGQAAEGVAQQVLGQINGAVAQAQGALSDAANQAQNMMNTGVNAVRTATQQAVEQASNQIAQAENQAAQAAQQAQQQLQQAAQQAQAAGQQALGQAQQAAQQAQQQAQAAAQQAQQMAQQAQQQTQQQLNQASQQLNQAAQQAQQAAQQAQQQAQAAAQQLQQAGDQAAGQAQAAAQQAQQAAQQAQQAANQAAQQAQQMAQQSQQQVQQASQAAQQQMSQAANQAQQQVNQATQQATQQAQQAGQMTQQGAQQVQNQVGQATQQAQQTVSNTAQSAYSQAGTSVNQAAQNLTKGLGGF